MRGLKLGLKGLLTSGSALAVITVAMVGAPGAAAAQTPVAETVEEVVVTAASRIARSGFTAPTPVTIISGEDLKARAQNNLADTLNEMPTFAGSTTPSTTANSSLLTGGNYLNLRGLGTSRTLLLVNGRRHVPTDLSGASVDLNVIPTGLVDRVEVITGGASAAWGSDAVAGVVNLILKNKLDGFLGEVQAGRSERGDNNEVRTTLSWGSTFAEGRGDLILSGEYSKSDGVPHQTDRAWTKEYGIITNSSYAPGNGQFRQLIVPNAHLAVLSPGGLIIAGPLRGTQFLSGGVVAPFTYGTSVGTLMSGGDGVNLGSTLPLKSPLTRGNFYLSGHYDFTSTLKGFVEASYARSHSINDLVPTYSTGTVIRVDNAYLPASVRAQMVARNLPAIVLGRVDYDLPLMRPESDQTTQRIVLGLEGKLQDWSWNASYQRGRSEYESVLHGNRIVANYALATDAVLNASGEVICRSTLTNPINGCVPMNVFGQGSPSAASVAYTTADQRLDSRLTEQTAEFGAQGDLFTLPAGKATLAVGALYREDKLKTQVDALSLVNAFLIGNPKPNAGTVKAKEIFGEVVVPLLADLTLVRKLEFNGAARRTDYNISGGVTTWKAGLSYEPVEQLRFRATRSRDIRAPNLSELYTTDLLNFGVINDPGTNQQATARLLTTGNPNLTPESADTTTFGVVYQPSWAPGLRASVDVYDIDIKDVISSIGGQATVDQCATGNQALCALISRDAAGVISEVRLSPVNLAGLSTRGIDIEASYTTDLAKFSPFSGVGSLRVLATYVDEKIIDDGVTAIDRAGDVGSNHNGVPKWRVNATATYANGPWIAALNGRYIQGGAYDNTYGPYDINDNTIPARAYLNANLRYTVIDSAAAHVEVYGGVTNLLDTDPPVNVFNGSQPRTTNYELYDIIGRAYTVGMRFKY